MKELMLTKRNLRQEVNPCWLNDCTKNEYSKLVESFFRGRKKLSGDDLLEMVASGELGAYDYDYIACCFDYGDGWPSAYTAYKNGVLYVYVNDKIYIESTKGRPSRVVGKSPTFHRTALLRWFGRDTVKTIILDNKEDGASIERLVVLAAEGHLVKVGVKHFLRDDAYVAMYDLFHDNTYIFINKMLEHFGYEYVR